MLIRTMKNQLKRSSFFISMSNKPTNYLQLTDKFGVIIITKQIPTCKPNAHKLTLFQKRNLLLRKNMKYKPNKTIRNQIRILSISTTLHIMKVFRKVRKFMIRNIPVVQKIKTTQMISKKLFMSQKSTSTMSFKLKSDGWIIALRGMLSIFCVRPIRH